MSLASEQSSQPLVTSVFLDSQSSHNALSQALLDLSRCESIYDGDVETATAAISYSVVKNLGTTSCQVWLYTDDRNRFSPVAYYGTRAIDEPGQDLLVADHADYFHSLTQHDWLVVNTGSHASATDKSTGKETLPPYLSDKAQTITALVEIPIYHQKQLVGILCCTQQCSPRVWQAAEKSFVVTAACLIALAISHKSH